MGIFPKKSGSSTFASLGATQGPTFSRARNASVVIGDFSKSNYDGKHVKAQWSGEALVVNTDERPLELATAEAGVAVIRTELETIPQTIKPNTAKYRAQAARSYKANKKWALARYKDRPPGAANSDRLYNDSGSLAAKVRIAVARGVSIVTQIDGVRHNFVVSHNLRQLVPALKNGLGRYPAVTKALTKAVKAAVSKTRIAEGLGHARMFGKRALGGRGAERISGSK